MLDLCRDVLDVMTHFRQIGFDRYGDPVSLTGCGVVEMNLSQLIVDEGRAISIQAANVRSIVMQCFVYAFRCGIVTEYPDVPFSSRQKVDPWPVGKPRIYREWCHYFERTISSGYFENA